MCILIKTKINQASSLRVEFFIENSKTCAFSSGTQKSNVTVSYPKPRKNADVFGNSFRKITGA